MGRIVWVVLLLCVVWLGGCARFGITAQSKLESSADIKGLTQGDISYQKGVQILRSKLTHSSVQVELAQKDIAHNVIVLYISAQLAREPASASAQVFSPAHIRAFVDDVALEILDYERLRKSDYDFIDILQDFNIPTPTPSVNTQMAHYNISPFYYVASPGFLYFPLMASPFMIESPSSIAYAQEKRGALKVLLINALRESSLSSTKAQGGFVVIRAKGIKDSGTMIVEVRIANEAHKFAFRLEKLR
ncbi:hypothetical protein [Helicobacter canis]|uniref:hypothetical protein n=1 Tax=Helicobacter canis TaxID=29419 RepID=UPI00041DFCC5|nr:hypothetical protein [Helicobacter canis]